MLRSGRLLLTPIDLSLDEQLMNVNQQISRDGGKHGYFLLYVCLFESQDGCVHQGHKDAVDKLTKTG